MSGFFSCGNADPLPSAREPHPDHLKREAGQQCLDVALTFASERLYRAGYCDSKQSPGPRSSECRILETRPMRLSVREEETTMARHATKMVPELSTVSEPFKTAGIANPTEDEIATAAYQLWLDSGCPIGLEQEHWFRAEAMLRYALAAKCEDLSKRPSVRRCDTRTDSGMLVEFRWEGHWEVWESEWGGPVDLGQGHSRCWRFESSRLNRRRVAGAGR